MNCQNQKCRATGSRVTKSFSDAAVVKRWRACPKCGSKWTTDERPNANSLTLPAGQERPPPQRLLSPMATNGQVSTDSDQKNGKGGHSGGDLRGGSDPGSGSGPDRRSENTGVDPKIWTTSDWCRKYGIAWTGKYQKFYGSASDPKACSLLGELLERLPRGEVLEAQAIAGTMFRRFLASEKPSVVEASHPFAFFVTDFGSLRLDPGPAETGGRKLPEYG